MQYNYLKKDPKLIKWTNFKLDAETLLDSIRSGKMVISSGPFMNVHTAGNFDNRYDFHNKITVSLNLVNVYIRGKLITVLNGKKFLCMTNPVYIDALPEN